MQLLPFVPEFAVTLANFSAVVYVYNSLVLKLHALQEEAIKLRTELESAKQSGNRKAIEQSMEESALRTRLEILEVKLAQVDTLLTENLAVITKLLEKHSDKFEQYDEQIRSFFEKYDLKQR